MNRYLRTTFHRDRPTQEESIAESEIPADLRAMFAKGAYRVEVNYPNTDITYEVETTK